MAKIPLRAYIKEIENYIERGEIEQAVAHAKNILKSYPKQIDTYRLLGKAFLESQRYSEAADILQRVLSVIPDDFVSQIGMSIIREDEGNLDAAIWHMERAYEVQPFNPAVQDELRRLYGRRDGIEPPKIRLTRGALVRMYARGELYPQAIAETRAALSEDPQRLDLRVLLARLYYLSGHKNDAAEVCSELLSKLPYCYEANRLLAEILPTTSRAEEAKKFQQRIIALDPYAAFTSPTAPTSEQVPDQAVTVEQFIWDSAITADQQQPNWTRNIGVQWETGEGEEEEVLPDWLNTLKPESTPQASAPTQSQAVQEESPTDIFAAAAEESQGAGAADAASAQDDLVPDWMKEAGWSYTDRKADDIMASQPQPDEEEQEPGSGEIIPAEIPDWMQSMAPSEAGQTSPEEEERTEWLENLFTEQQSSSNGKETAQAPDLGLVSEETAGEEADLPNWLSGLQGTSQEAPAASADESPLSTDDALPDWFAQISTESANPAEAEIPTPADLESSTNWMSTTEAAQPEETPDWLLSFEEPSTAPAAEVPAEPTSKAEDVSAAGDLSDWLAAFESETNNLAPADMAPGEAPTEAAAISPEAELPTEAAVSNFEADLATEFAADEAQAGELPDWLNALKTEETAPSAETQVEAQNEEQPFGEGLPNWLSGLEAGEPESQVEQPTAFMANEPLEAESAAQELPTAPEQPMAAVDQPAAEQPGEAAMPDLADMDAAMAWLESLAAKQGADEATLVTRPEDRTETPPEWVKEEIKRTGSLPPLPEEQVSAPVELAETEFTEEGQAEELRSWLSGLNIETEPAASEPVAQELPAEEPAVRPMAEIQPETIEPMVVEPPLVEQPAVIDQPAAQQQPAEAAMPDFSDMDAAMAWLESLAAKQGADEATLVTRPEDRTETPPDWVLQQTEAAALDKAEAELEPAQPAAIEQPAAYEELAVEQPASELPVMEEAQPAEELPDWLKDLEQETPTAATEVESAAAEPTQPLNVSAAVEQPATVEQQEPELPAAIEQPSTEAAIPDFSDMDAAMAWLESLAAKQGADEATLVTRPEDRTETPPDWVLNQLETAAGEPSVESAATNQLADEELPAVEADLPDWLKDASEARAETLPPEPWSAAQELPVAQEPPMVIEPAAYEELAALDQPAAIDQPVVEQPAANLPTEELPAAEKQPIAEGEMDMDAAFAWLESLAAKQGADEATLVTAPDERQETPPEWVTQEAEAEAFAVETPAEAKPTTDGQPVANEWPLDELPATGTFETETLKAELPGFAEQEIELPAVEPEQRSAAFEEPTAEVEPEIEPQTMESETTAPSAETWMTEIEQSQVLPQTEEALPDWLKVEMEEQPTAAEPESIADWLKNLENEPETQAIEPIAPPSPGDFRSAWEPEVEIAHSSTGEEPVGMPQAGPQSLADLQDALNHGNLERALDGYNRLITNGEHLEATIHDLRDALYRYPVDINLWQALGDAYARNNQLQEALDAYTKAEELLR